MIRFSIATSVLACCCLSATVRAEDPYVRQTHWLDSMIATLEAAADARAAQPAIPPLTLFTRKDFTVMAWVNTTKGGTIVSLFRPDGIWAAQGKTFFISERGVGLDIGWVGYVGASARVADGRWHHVALTQKDRRQTVYVDGRASANGALEVGPTPAECLPMLGYTSANFPQPNAFVGSLDDLRIFSAALDGEAVAAYAADKTPRMAAPPVVAWTFDAGTREPALDNQGCAFGEGRRGRCLVFDGKSRVLLRTAGRLDPGIWTRLHDDFTDDAARLEMQWEQEDGIWDAWVPGQYQVLADAYARAVRSELRDQAADVARRVTDRAGMKGVRSLYLEDRWRRHVDGLLSRYDIPALRKMARFLGMTCGSAYDAPRHLPAIEAAGQGILDGTLAGEQLSARLRKLRFEALFRDNPLVGFDKVIFVKRQTYNANHYYTEFINGQHRGGGNICVLDLATGEVRDVVRGLPEGGVFRRFDLSYDAKRIVFCWKRSWEEGYRIYECGVDGSGLRQLTFPPDNEADLHRRYAIAGYHHGTDDMDPCYLPSGEIVFASTRCQFGILCDQPDIFTTTTLFKMDRDGGNLTMLSNSSVSEAAPSMTFDGRILYTRWEYVDKGSSCVKCLWSMKPDGSGSAEVYGNDIATPPTMIFGRAIPGAPNKYVMTGSPHCCPWNALGTVIRLDMNKNIRTRGPMEYMTPDVDVQGLGGEAQLVYKKDGQWVTNLDGPVYREPYPLCEQLFLVAYKPAGPAWDAAAGYGLSMLDEQGDVVEFYRDPAISCWEPMPLVARPTPPVIESTLDARLAAADRAVCVVSDVQHGMEGVAPGEVKYLRILEQRPRPWSARRYWDGDGGYGQQHVVTTKFTHLGLKVQHGVVPVEDDGSACFYVPTRSNVFFQALDENFRSIQTERTLVNYMPGETRACVGCHETPDNALPQRTLNTPKALGRPPSTPGPQPGDDQAGKIIDFRTMVQPVLDEHCIRCHSGEKPKADLDLSATETEVFNRAYENLMKRGVCGRINNEVAPKTGNAEYQPPYTFGSYSSILGAMFSDGQIRLQDATAAKRAEHLAEVHATEVKLPLAAKIRLWNWLDTNCQFYGSYWGRRNIQYKSHPNYRPISTLDEARSTVCPIPDDQR